MFLWTIRTILVFCKFSLGYGKTLPKKRKWGKITFLDYCENELTHWRYVLKSSFMLGAHPQGLLFPENRHFWILETSQICKRCSFCVFLQFSDPWWGLWCQKSDFVGLWGVPRLPSGGDAGGGGSPPAGHRQKLDFSLYFYISSLFFAE